MQPAHPLNPLTATGLATMANIQHGFFTRQGGVSTGLYDSLNCGIGSADQRPLVLENRARVAHHFGAEPGQLLTCHQIHSADAIVVTEPWAPDSQPRADALVTNVPGLVLGALAADCTPILFADPHARVIAAAHSGWKGALAGIVASTIAAMETLGASRRHITAAIGPCIGPDAYEVGDEFREKFVKTDATHARYFHLPANATKPHFDLPTFVASRCEAEGLATIESLNLCTYADQARFYSYRRTTHAREPDYGRQISAIVLTA